LAWRSSGNHSDTFGILYLWYHLFIPITTLMGIKLAIKVALKFQAL